MYRWVTGELCGLPYPMAQATLEEMFGEPVERLVGPPYRIGALRPVWCRDEAAYLDAYAPAPDCAPSRTSRAPAGCLLWPGYNKAR